MGVFRLLYWGAQSWGPHGQRGCCEAGACSGLPTSPAAHHEGNILVFTYTSLCLSTRGGSGEGPPSLQSRDHASQPHTLHAPLNHPYFRK